MRRMQVVLLVSTLTLSSGEARGACNVIPAAATTFRSTLGTVDRPFAGPGDVIEVAADGCAQTAGLPQAVGDLVVSLVFSPMGGSDTIVVLTPGTCPDVDAALAACGLPPSTRTMCRHVEPPDLEKPSGRPDHLRVTFPDTDDLVGTPDDDLTLAGPVALAVSVRGAALPCAALSSRCGVGGGALACVGPFFADGTCAAEPHTEFPGLAALPPPNDFAALCTDPAFPAGPCTGAADRTARLTVDAAGNLLVPVDWSGILVRDADVPVPRLLAARSMVEAFAAAAGVPRVPSLAFLTSYAPEGRRLPPLFEGQIDLTSRDVLKLFGSADAAHTILKMHRRAPVGRCSLSSSRACSANVECPAGERCLRYLACDGGSLADLPCAGGEDADPCATPASDGSTGTCAPTACLVCVSGRDAGRACRDSGAC